MDLRAPLVKLFVLKYGTRIYAEGTTRRCIAYADRYSEEEQRTNNEGSPIQRVF
jgi:hypothetical protein